MKQSEFLALLQTNKRYKSKLKNALGELLNDGEFYFALGEIFGELNINGWESESFINKVCKICDIEF